jgi:branched-chain amino acid transport system substrate-binding protein
MKFRLVITSLLVLAVLLAGCAQQATPTPPAAQPPAQDTPGAQPPAQDTPAQPPAAGDPLKVAILAPLSGPVPTFGASTRDGALMAIDEWNERGGVLGRQVQAIVEDSQCTPGPAVNAANKVIDSDGVRFIIGEVCSSASIPVSEITEQRGILQISPTSTNTDVTLNADGSTKRFVFRACFIDPFQGDVMATFARNQGHETAFVLFDQGNDYVLGLSEAFQESFTAKGGQIVGTAAYTSADTDFSAILTQVQAANPDVLYLPDYYNIVNLVGAQAKQIGITAAMMGGDGWDSADLDMSAAEGGYFSNHYSPEEERPVVQDFVQRYQDRHGAVPDALATLAYDAANLLLAAIEEAGTDDPAVVADTLAAISYEAVSGIITFDEFHNPIKTAAIIHVTGGEVVFVERIEP